MHLHSSIFTVNTTLYKTYRTTEYQMRLARGPMGPGLLRTPAGDLPSRRDKPAAAKGLRRACPLRV